MPLQTRTDIKGLSRFLFAEGAEPDRLHLHISEVPPGERAHPPHQHAGQEIFFVLEGCGDILIEDETHQINEGEAVHLKCDIVHGIRNAGDAPLKYAVIIAREA